jgi:hypothetical protein
LLTKLESSGLILKYPKYIHGTRSKHLWTHHLRKWIRPDNAKIKAVGQATPPKSCSEVRSFLGLTNYCSRYIPIYSTITYPLRQLTKAHAQFIWTNTQEQAFQALKRALTSAPVLAH